MKKSIETIKAFINPVDKNRKVFLCLNNNTNKTYYVDPTGVNNFEINDLIEINL